MKIIKELVTKWTYKVDASQLKTASKSLQALRREMAQTTKQGKSKLLQERKQVDGLRGAYRRLTDQIRRKNVAESGSTSASSGFAGFKSFAALRGLGLNAGAAAGLAAGPGIAAITGISGSLLAAGRKEQAVEGFRGFVGNKAEKLTADLSKFAEKTPLNIQNVRDFATEILAMGQSVDKVIPIMKTIGDATGGNLDRMSRALFNYLEVINKEAADKVDLKQFVRAGIPIYQQLEKQLGVTKDQLSAMVSEGKITGKEVAKAFQLMTGEGGMFENRMEKMSKTFLGKLSNLGDAVTGLAEKVGEVLLPEAESFIDNLKLVIEASKDGVEWLGKLEHGFSTLGLIVRGIALIFKPILFTFAALYYLVTDFVYFVQGKDSVFGRLFKAFEWWGNKISTTFDAAKKSVSDFFSEFSSPTASKVFDWMSNFWNASMAFIEHGPDAVIERPSGAGSTVNNFNIDSKTNIGLKEGVTPGEAEAMQNRVNTNTLRTARDQAARQKAN